MIPKKTCSHCRTPLQQVAGRRPVTRVGKQGDQHRQRQADDQHQPEIFEKLAHLLPPSSQTFAPWSFLGLKFAGAQASRKQAGGGAQPDMAVRAVYSRQFKEFPNALPAARLPLRQGRARAAHVGGDARISPRQASQGLCQQDQRADRDDSELSGASLIQVVRERQAAGNSKLFNNSAQLWNHSFFWQCLAPPQGQQPDGKLAKLIDDGFGSAEALLEKLQEEAVNHFASGWAWLVLDRGKLEITSLHDADTPIVHEGMVPLFTLDVWEHAYYIDYRNERPRFAIERAVEHRQLGLRRPEPRRQRLERADQQGEGARSPEFTA